MEKINKEQINKLLEQLRKYDLMYEWLYILCNVDCLTDITVKQCNSILLILNTIYENLKEKITVEII